MKIISNLLVILLQMIIASVTSKVRHFRRYLYTYQHSEPFREKVSSIFNFKKSLNPHTESLRTWARVVNANSEIQFLDLKLKSRVKSIDIRELNGDRVGLLTSENKLYVLQFTEGMNILSREKTVSLSDVSKYKCLSICYLTARVSIVLCYSSGLQRIEIHIYNVA